MKLQPHLLYILKLGFFVCALHVWEPYLQFGSYNIYSTYDQPSTCRGIRGWTIQSNNPRPSIDLYTAYVFVRVRPIQRAVSFTLLLSLCMHLLAASSARRTSTFQLIDRLDRLCFDCFSWINHESSYRRFTAFGRLELEAGAGMVWEKNTVGLAGAGAGGWSGVREKYCWAGAGTTCRTQWLVCAGGYLVEDRWDIYL